MGRSPCCEKAHTNKGAWTKEEDERLIAYIRTHGEGCWRSLPNAAGLLRCGKSCRLRWINYLRPDLKRGNFTEEEDEHIIKLHSLLGNKWSLIAGRLPGRTDNEIKNYWNTHIRRKLLSRGIDPTPHRPVNEPSTTQKVTTISFGVAENKIKDEEDKKMINVKAESGLSQLEDEIISSPFREQCPDLNLELGISPPSRQNYQQSHHDQDLKQSPRCFACSLGIQNSKDCNCSKNNNNFGNIAKYNFLGLKTNGVLDYRTLESK
ncbi:hypothetical protein RND71_041929 [Anisodus tanguticus]|uniref:Uncharacterized protein n=1 Tax=Anisodus tanguticus TaxID=243964 RepID=A0AAE1QYD4_9SOLA|nr:hypothetical protein RND71_041929 [Anisodus tanguticus]